MQIHFQKGSILTKKSHEVANDQSSPKSTSYQGWEIVKKKCCKCIRVSKDAHRGGEDIVHNPTHILFWSGVTRHSHTPCDLKEPPPLADLCLSHRHLVELTNYSAPKWQLCSSRYTGQTPWSSPAHPFSLTFRRLTKSHHLPPTPPLPPKSSHHHVLAGCLQ